MRRKIFALGVALGVLSIAVALRAEPIRDDVIKVTFPERIGTLNLQGRQQYQQPGLGYSLRYQDENLFKVDVYVYDNNLVDIGDGADSRRVMQEFDSVLNVFPLMEKKGRYKDVKQLSRGTRSFAKGSLPFLWSRCQYSQSQGEGVAYLGLRVSETYLSGKSGKFIKVRLTLKETEFKAKQAEIDGFMKHLANILGSQQTAPSDR